MFWKNGDIIKSHSWFGAIFRLLPGTVTHAETDDNYQRIKDEVIAIIEEEMERNYDTPELAHLLYQDIISILLYSLRNVDTVKLPA